MLTEYTSVAHVCRKYQCTDTNAVAVSCLQKKNFLNYLLNEPSLQWSWSQDRLDSFAWKGDTMLPDYVMRKIPNQCGLSITWVPVHCWITQTNLTRLLRSGGIFFKTKDGIIRFQHWHMVKVWNILTCACFVLVVLLTFSVQFTVHIFQSFFQKHPIFHYGVGAINVDRKSFLLCFHTANIYDN